MYVKVYFESSAHAELVAIFRDEELYTEALGGLEAEAEKNGMIVTEGMVDDPQEIAALDLFFK